MAYVKCEKCGITRNIDEAPMCPVCAEHASKRASPKKSERAREPEKKVGSRLKWCESCGTYVRYTPEKMEGGGVFKFCIDCGESV
jgi:hypothetical protein